MSIINTIVIPADKTKPIRHASYDSADYKNLTALIFDGNREGTFDRMVAEDSGDQVTFWFDDNGLARLDTEEAGTIINLRAMQLYCHLAGIGLEDYGVPLVGDYVITGGVDGKGESLDAPDWIMNFPFDWHHKYLLRQPKVEG